jgi:hypothetical protein
MSIRVVTISGALFAAAFAHGQVVQLSRSGTDQLAERLIVSDDADLAYEDLYENLASLTANPLDLNRATRDDLLSLGLLSNQQADNLINYRNENGLLFEIYELQTVPSFDLQTIRQILPYVRVGPSVSAKTFLGRVRSQQTSYFFSRFERTLEKSRGYTHEADSASKYTGNPLRIYSRFRLNSPGDLSVGFTVENDAGEQLKWDSTQRGFDFYSAHLQLINKGPLVNLVAGDYVAQFGQGLAVGGGYGIGKGSETITTLRRVSTGFAPYSSANESGFFRGVAATARLPALLRAPTLKHFGASVRSASQRRGSVFLHSFISSLPRDASGSEETSLAVLQSGKHRTPGEHNGRHRLTEQNYGLAFEYKGSMIEAGCLVHRTVYQRPINKSPTVYNQFDFGGAGNTNVGVFGSYHLGNFSVFGELAQTLGHGSGWVAGILGSISRSIDVSLLVRHYDRDYYTFYSNAISENTSPRNERGIYWGWKHAINRRLSYTAYADLFSFPWLRFRSYRPSTGSESLVRCTYRLSKAVDFFVQFRDERKVRNEPLESPVYRPAQGVRQNWTLGSSLALGSLSLRTRIQFSSYRQVSAANGFAMAFDAAYDWSKVSIDTRFAIFDTDDFDNRQYMNERDVLMAFSFPAYYGEGTRTYVLCRFRPARWVDLSLKIARTNYFNSVSSGSGGDRIDGNSRHELKLQVIFRVD